MGSQESAFASVCSIGSDGGGGVTVRLTADETMTRRGRFPAPNPLLLAIHPDRETPLTVERIYGGRVSTD